MQAAQIDSKGGRKMNVEAQVAQSQLHDVLPGGDLLFAKGLRAIRW